MRKHLVFPSRSDTNRAVQPQKMARCWNFEWDCAIGVAPNKDAENCKCAVVCVYTKTWFSHDAAIY